MEFNANEITVIAIPVTLFIVVIVLEYITKRSKQREQTEDRDKRAQDDV